jgi:hypothetical protein
MNDSDKNRVVLAEAVARAWQDDDFRKKLLAEPTKTLVEAGMELDKGVKLEAHENTENVTYVVLLPGGKLDHKDELVSALEEALPLDGHEIRLVQNTDTLGHVVIPARPSEFEEGEMDAAEVAQMAGGVGVSYHDVAANVEGVANAVGGTDVAGVTVAVAAAAVVLT